MPPPATPRTPRSRRQIPVACEPAAPRRPLVDRIPPLPLLCLAAVSPPRSRMRRATVVWSSWAAVAVLSLAGSAFAEPSAADKETARRLMSEGRAQRDAKDLAAALQSFQAADALMHVPTTALEVARTQIALGKLVEAHDKLLAMDRIPATPDEPRPFVEARAAAETLGNDVEARIPTLKITILGLSAGATPTVLVDGTEIPPAALMAKRAIDPGHHVVTANVEG